MTKPINKQAEQPGGPFNLIISELSLIKADLLDNSNPVRTFSRLDRLCNDIVDLKSRYTWKEFGK